MIPTNKMIYFCCVWLCIWCIVCGELQHRVVGLHIQQAPLSLQRIARQAIRYNNGGSMGGLYYRPSISSNFNLRNGALDPSTTLTSSALDTTSSSSGQRPIGVGAYSFGGMASGHPTNGNMFVISNSAKGTGLGNSRPNIGPTIIGSGSVAGDTVGRPQQLQQALLKAAQYQLQQQHQQLQQFPQQQQLRRHMPQKQFYRQRPVNTYQQYN